MVATVFTFGTPIGSEIHLTVAKIGHASHSEARSGHSSTPESMHYV